MNETVSGEGAGVLHTRSVYHPVMGWERRGSQWHFYTARRVGGRVVKEYVPDAVAPLAARLEAEQRAEHVAERTAFRRLGV